MADPRRYRPVDRLLYALLTLYSCTITAWLVWAEQGSRPWLFEATFLVGGILPGIATCLLVAYQITAADRRRIRFSPAATLISLAIITAWFLATWFAVAKGFSTSFFQLPCPRAPVLTWA